jgi:hypothetical protein
VVRPDMAIVIRGARIVAIDRPPRPAFQETHECSILPESLQYQALSTCTTISGLAPTFLAPLWRERRPHGARGKN